MNSYYVNRYITPSKKIGNERYMLAKSGNSKMMKDLKIVERNYKKIAIFNGYFEIVQSQFYNILRIIQFSNIDQNFLRIINLMEAILYIHPGIFDKEEKRKLNSKVFNEKLNYIYESYTINGKLYSRFLFTSEDRFLYDFAKNSIKLSDVIPAKQFKSLYDNICNYISVLQEHDSNYKLLSYIAYFMSDEIEIYNTVYPYLIHDNSWHYLDNKTQNNFTNLILMLKNKNNKKTINETNNVSYCKEDKIDFLVTNSNILIIMAENMILCNGYDFFDYNDLFFYNTFVLKFKYEISKKFFSEMLKLIEEAFKPKMKIHKFKDILKDTPFIYDAGYNFVASKNGDCFFNVSP